MEMSNNLKKYTHSGIEDWGAYQSDDFKRFARLYKNFLNKMCKNNNWELVKFNTGHYYCSWFIKSEDKYIYCSFSDTRYFFRDWYKSILYRSAKSDSDYTGGTNNYSIIECLDSAINRLFNRM